jgi:hypothetical protein
VLAQGVADPGQHGQAERGRQLVPADAAVDGFRRLLVQPPAGGVVVPAAVCRRRGGLAPSELGTDGQPGPERRRPADDDSQTGSAAALGRDGQPRVDARDERGEGGRAWREIALRAGRGRGEGVAGVDQRGPAQGPLQLLVAQENQVSADQDGPDAEHPQHVDDRPVPVRVGAEAPGQLLRREQGHAAVEQPDRRQRVAGAGTAGHGILLVGSVPGRVAR